MKQLLILFFCFLLAIPAHADVAYSPPANSFYEENRQHCTVVERNYYSNGEKGYISLHTEPNGTKTAYLTNGVRLHLYCTYGDWAMITHENNTELDTPVWAKTDELYLIYDGESFMEEYRAEIQWTGGKMMLPEGAEEIYVYEYPGAADPWAYSYFEPEIVDVTSRTYTDTEGRRWGYISYYRGIRNRWVCLDDPISVIPPFGGDPNLALIEGSPTPDPITPDPETEIVEAETPIVPAKKPPRIVLNPLPVLAVVLVLAAVVAAVILIAVCYRKKK
ncbi:MAG: hypothetical protein IJP27_02745 [Clostridia bacterium]|nr:hypothetical protein [Clostridia bacterium]